MLLAATDPTCLYAVARRFLVFGGDHGSHLKGHYQFNPNSLDTQFCMDALEMALTSGRSPGSFCSVQGCQFTFAEFVGRLQA